MLSALVLNGDLKSALCAVRSLGAQGIEVMVGAERSTGMALHSRYATETFVYPSPELDRRGFIEAVRVAAESCEELPAIFSFSDATYLALFDHRSEFEGIAKLVFPEEKAVEIAFDKAATHSEAKILGVPVIKTHFPERPDELKRLSGTLVYPAVVKPRHSVTWNNAAGVSGTAVFVHSGEELEERFFELHGMTNEYPLVQPFIKGEEYGVEVLAEHGEICALIVHHRIRSLTPSGGASVLKETVEDSELSRTMIEYSTKLIGTLSWHGPMMIEWKVDSDSRAPLLMEMNGRFWGSLPLSVAAGVDVPYLFYQLARGEIAKGPMISARPNVVSQHYLGDVLHLARVWFSGDRMRPYTFPKRLRALRDFLFLPRGTRSDVWSLRDIKPGIMEYVDVFKRRQNT